VEDGKLNWRGGNGGRPPYYPRYASIPSTVAGHAQSSSGRTLYINDAQRYRVTPFEARNTKSTVGVALDLWLHC
jgi:hypothetical protein